MNGNGNDVKKLELPPEPRPPQAPAAPPPGSQPSASPPSPPVAAQEDEAIFSFFKRYMALLTAVGTLPIVTAGINVLSPPPGNGGKALSAISTGACIIVLGICILFKNMFASWSVSKRLKFLPPLLALVFVVLGILLTAQFSGEPISLLHISTLPEQTCYLLIFPCFVAALGITLMASYSQFYGTNLERKIDQKSLDHEKNERVKTIIDDYASALTASTDKTIGKFTDAVLKQCDDLLKKLKLGYIEASGPRTLETQKLLFDHFKKSLYAVSDRDLRFWLNGFSDQIRSKDDLVAKEYLRLNIDAVSRKTAVTRIFIFEDSDFNYNQDAIVSVLRKHHEAGIGWGLLLYEELPAYLKNAGQSLNFAIMDHGAAVVVYANNTADNQRRLYVLLNVPTPYGDYRSEYCERHPNLIAQCWLASDRFCEEHKPKGRVLLSEARKENENKTNALNFGSGKIVEIKTGDEIADAIKFVRDLRRKNMLYWGEVRSQLVLDLEGTWWTVLRGQEPDGTRFEHRGTCRGIIENGQAHFSGTRQLTVRNEPSKHQQSTVLAAPWTSSVIEFTEDGRLQYTSTISVDGAEIPGFGSVRFSPDRKMLKGSLQFISNGSAIAAEVEFDRKPWHGHLVENPSPAASSATPTDRVPLPASDAREARELKGV